MMEQENHKEESRTYRYINHNSKLGTIAVEAHVKKGTIQIRCEQVIDNGLPFRGTRYALDFSSMVWS